MKIKKASIITSIVIIALIIYASVSLISLKQQINEAYIQQEALEKTISELEVKNAELEYAIEHSDDDDVLANIARDKLGYVGKNEKVFVNGNK